MLVTVVTPTLNAMEYLPAAVESVKAATSSRVQVEHVIVDGGSTDGTVEYAREQGLVVLTGKDRGIFDAINKGSFNSTGELIGFLGADDVMLPGGLDAIVEAYERSGKRWVVGGIRWIDQQGESLGDLAALPEWMSARMIACLGWNPVMHMATYISRGFFTELGGFNIEFKDSGDYEMFMRARSAEPYARVSQRIACFRRTGENNSVVMAERVKWQQQHVLDTFGPAGGAERALWRVVMKLWVNLANPGWLAVKLSQALRAKIGLRSGGHFAKVAG